MIYGDNPAKWNEREADPNDRLGLNAYTYKPDIHAIMQSGNLYVYGLSNPGSWQDPSGQLIMAAASLACLAGAFLVVFTVALVSDPNLNRAANAAITQIANDIDRVAKSIGKSVDDISSYLVNEANKKQQKKESKSSDKEKSSDIPSWARGEKPKQGESGNEYAKRVMDQKYGAGNYKKGPGTEYNKLRKYGDRGGK